MKSKIGSIPLVLILLILGIVLPLGAFGYALHRVEMKELKRIQPVTVVKTVEVMVTATPEPNKIGPAKTVKAPTSTQSGQVK